MNESRITGLHLKVNTHEQQLLMCVDMLKSLSADVKVLRSEADRARERDDLYDRWIKIVPLIFAAISTLYWVFVHTK